MNKSEYTSSRLRYGVVRTEGRVFQRNSTRHRGALRQYEPTRKILANRNIQLLVWGTPRNIDKYIVLTLERKTKQLDVGEKSTVLKGGGMTRLFRLA